MNNFLVVASMLALNIAVVELHVAGKLSRTPRQFNVFDRYDSNSFNFPNNRPDRQLSWGAQQFNSDRYPLNNNRRQAPNWRDNDIPFVFELPSGRQTEQQNFPNPISTTRRPATTAFPAIPGMGTTRSPCEDACQITPQYNPICADNGLTYFNRERYNCARRCGVRAQVRHLGACTRLPGTPVN